VKGRKRHLLVEITGLIVGVLVHEANIQDHDGGKELLSPRKRVLLRLQLIWADSAYKKGGFVEWVKATLGWQVEIVEYPWSGLRGSGPSSIGRRSGPAAFMRSSSVGSWSVRSRDSPPGVESPKTTKCFPAAKKLGSSSP